MYTFLLEGGTIGCSKKQSVVSSSTMEAEYITASAATQETIWFRQFLQDLEVIPHASDLITLHCDSMAVIGHAKSARCHAKTKHLDIKFNFIINQSEEVTLEYIPMKRMVADPLTELLDSSLSLSHVRVYVNSDIDVLF